MRTQRASQYDFLRLLRFGASSSTYIAGRKV